MTVRERMRDEERAKKWWAGLTDDQRWALGDALVLGEFDWREWFEHKESRAFMNELDQQRMLWEMTR